MNIMDKQTIIDFCNKGGNNTLSAIEIIAAYCEEKGKKPEEIQLFVQALHIMPIMISNYLLEVIKYYKIKYEIFDLYIGDKHLLTF